MRSSSGISCLRLEDGRASKSRLRGQIDRALIQRPLHSRTSVNLLGLQLDFWHLDCDIVVRPLIIKISDHSHRNDKRPDNCYCEWFHLGILQFECFRPHHLIPTLRDAWGCGPVTGSRPLYQCFNTPRERSFEALVPIIDILLHHVLGMTVALLDLAFELLALAVYRGKVVVSELAPLFLDLADELLPVTFDTIPIHETLL